MTETPRRRDTFWGSWLLPARTRQRWWWAVAMPFLWALGWVTTTLAGIPAEEQFTIFGASGAATFSVLSGLLLSVLLPVRQPAAAGTARTKAPAGVQV